MPVCTFFGHRDCPETIKPKLREVLADLISNRNVDMFYVGHQGQFDAYVHGELKKLKQEYPHINYAVVLAYPSVIVWNVFLRARADPTIWFLCGDDAVDIELDIINQVLTLQ